MKKISIVLALLLTNNIFGVTYFNPSSIGTSAFSKGIGIQGFENNAVAVFENSARLTNVKKHSMHAFQTTILNDYEVKNISYATRINDNNAIAIGYMLLGSENIPKTLLGTNTEYNEEEVLQFSSYSYQNTLIKMGLQHQQTETISLGIDLNYYGTQLDSYAGHGANINASFLYQSSSGLTEITSVIENIIPNLGVSFSHGKEEDLPLGVRLAVRRNIKGVSIFTQMKAPDLNDAYYLFSIGSSYKMPRVPLNLYGSWYQYDVFEEIKNSVAVGIGLNLGWISTNFSFEKSDDPLSDNKHYFSLSIGI